MIYIAQIANQMLAENRSQAHFHSKFLFTDSWQKAMQFSSIEKALEEARAVKDAYFLEGDIVVSALRVKLTTVWPTTVTIPFNLNGMIGALPVSNLTRAQGTA